MIFDLPLNVYTRGSYVINNDPRYGGQKSKKKKKIKFLTGTHSLFKFNCSSSPIYSRLLFFDIYVASRPCDNIRCH